MTSSIEVSCATTGSVSRVGVGSGLSIEAGSQAMSSSSIKGSVPWAVRP